MGAFAAGGLWAPFALRAAFLATIVNRTSRSSCAEGLAGSGPRAIATRLRPIWTGVMSRPHGNPHQPSTAENSALPSCARTPHERHETRGVLRQLVIRSADHTLWLI